MSIFPHLLRIWRRVIYKPFSTIKSEYPTFVVVRVAWMVAVRYQVPRYCGWKLDICQLLSDAVVLSDTKYRDIADGNIVRDLR